MKILLEELSSKPSPPRQWIGSESWVTDRDMLRFSFLAGAIGFGIEKSFIPGLRDFLLDLSPSKVADSPLLTMFWEEAFNCRLVKSEATDRSVCDGTEDIKTLQSSYTDTSQLRITNMVYKAVLNQLKKVNFSQNGYDVSFDANGDPVATYELVNWQRNESGSIELVTVGQYDSSLPVGQEFLINRNLLGGGWHTVCTDSCPSGTRKVLQKGKPICCYDCTPCPEGEISNATDSFDCFPCPKEFWPNAERDTCLPKPVEFLSFNEPLGIVLAAFSIGGACLSIITAAVFYRHRSSPIVRANNSELSFLLLFSLTLCFLCSLTFIGAPSEWSCMLRHTAFGNTFVLCMSCVLGKTIVVLTAFKATLPGSNLMKWFGPSQQRLTVVSFTFIQCVKLADSEPLALQSGGDVVIGGCSLCILWLLSSRTATTANPSSHLPSLVQRICTAQQTAFLCELKSVLVLNSFGDGVKKAAGLTGDRTAAVLSTNASSVTCTTRQPAFSMDGDYVIGGVFSIHSPCTLHLVVYHYFKSLRLNINTDVCVQINPRELRFSHAMVFAIEQINNSTELLGIKLGYEIYDSCASVFRGGGLDPVFNTGDKCSQSGMVMAVVGESGSTPSISVSRIIGPFNIPNHFATVHACLISSSTRVSSEQSRVINSRLTRWPSW
ncbi:hypothetical protein F7725_020632 [Dissostichus mawsoni]|uniref:G-protein coupled receptors family 3 profile domain-containing protein n=1 Tax=Dissostichus mawsoni TaxID=36200 RepID=A0A7J5YDR1_DISMA|nr:hypothetical protein F7725_020632 [Dissostichus mawsoni]